MENHMHSSISQILKVRTIQICWFIWISTYLWISYRFLVLRFDNLDERTVMPSAIVISDEKRNLYSPEIFLYDIAFDPDLRNLNSPSYTPDESTGKLHWNKIKYKIGNLVTWFIKVKKVFCFKTCFGLSLFKCVNCSSNLKTFPNSLLLALNLQTTKKSWSL